MTELSADQRKHLKDADFAYIDASGERHLPIPDAEHVRNAVQRFGRTHFESSQAQKAAAQKLLKAAKRYDVEVGDDDDVRKAAG
jgi:hypothetical protein